MKRSTDRILTTHTGSLPRPQKLVDIMFAKEEKRAVDLTLLAERVRESVREVVHHQHDVGIDVVSDGEMSKPSYATYVTERLTGFGGKSERPKLSDILEHPNVASHYFNDPGVVRLNENRPACNGPVEPYGLAHHRGHWYLVGKTAEGDRMYRVDRMESLEVGEEPDAFKKPKNFDVRAAFTSQPWEAGSDPPVEATVRFDDDLAWWAARSLGVPEPEGELVAKVNVANVDAFVGWLLSFGVSAEVIEPASIREAVAGRVAEALEQLP